MPYPNLLHPGPLSLWQSTADLNLHRIHSNTVLSQSLWGLWVLVHPRFVWALWASLAGMGFDSKCDFTILPLLPSCWGFSFALGLGVFSSKSLRCCTAAAPAPTVLLGFSAFGHRLSPHSCSSTMQLLLQHSAAVHPSKQSIDWTLKLKTKIIKENVNFHCTLNTKELTHSCFFPAVVFPWMFQYRLWIS